jgi:hypothetical protein
MVSVAVEEKEASLHVMTSSQVLYSHFPGRTDINHEKSVKA